MIRFVLLFFVSFLIFGQSSTRYIEEANRFYIQGDYETAFNQINKYFFVTDEDLRTEKSYVLGEKICYFYIRTLVSSGNYLDINFIEKLVRSNERLLSPRVKNILSQLKSTSGEGVSTGVDNVGDIREVEPEGISSDYSSEELVSRLKNSLLEEELQKKSRNLRNLIILILTLSAFIATYLILILPVRWKLRELNILLPSFISRSTGILFINCLAIARKVDEVTGRKNNSVNSAELVYKISKYMNHTSYDSLIYYAAALVYDVGFLNIDRKTLHSKTITESELMDIKTHVEYSEVSLPRLPKKHKGVFFDAVTKHHENMDGSGYPSGLKGNEIPFIARALRVIESYNSQVSLREYKTISDKESAILSLREESVVYDQEIVDALDRVI